MKNNYTITSLEDIIKSVEEAGYVSDFTMEELEEAFSEEKQHKEPLFNYTLANEKSNKQ